jgi:hypothetical protein
MTTHSEADLQFEIGHVLFIDIVGYSKLLIDEQRERDNRARARGMFSCPSIHSIK